MEPGMMARDFFGALVIAVIYCALFLAVFWIGIEGPPGPLQKIVTVVVAILSFPLISLFLYLASPALSIGDVIRLAVLNGLLWGSAIVWAHRKLLNRLGRTRLF
jgi:hypothetical protein